MKFEIIRRNNEEYKRRDYRDAIGFELYSSGDPEIVLITLSFSDGEPEDAIIARDFNDIHSIRKLVEIVYKAGQDNEPLEIIEREGKDGEI